MKDKEFERLIDDIVNEKDYQELKHYRHHIRSNVYDHSVKVAYLCYRHHKRRRMKTNPQELIRGALLHDYYRYDRSKKDPAYRFHGVIHPKHALYHAKQKYPDLTKIEKDMIRRHMFPLTIIPPKTKEGRLICFYDKLAAISDLFRK